MSTTPPEPARLSIVVPVYSENNQHDNLFLGSDLSAGGFGKAISQQLPRWWQIGVKATF